MRIGILAPPWLPVPPKAYGGTESVIDALARGLSGAGHDVLLWTVGQSTCPVSRAGVYDHACTADMGNAGIEIRHVLCAYETFDRWGADIVHDHTTIGPLLARGPHTYRIVSTNHGPFNDEALTLYGAIDREVAVIAISRDQARRAGPLPVTAVIHHGLDAEQWPEGPGDGDDDGPYLAFLGRMAPEKGGHIAAQVARRAGVRLLMGAKMHSPTEREYYANWVAPLLGPDVVYLGEVDATAKLRLLRHARALLNPIGWPEPFGLAMVEALACGTPVIASSSGSVSEIIEHGRTGFVCDGIEQMVQAIHDLGRVDRCDCRQAVLTRFSADRMVQDHIAVYEALLERRPHPDGRTTKEPVGVVRVEEEAAA